MVPEDTVEVVERSHDAKKEKKHHKEKKDKKHKHKHKSSHKKHKEGKEGAGEGSSPAAPEQKLDDAASGGQGVKVLANGKDDAQHSDVESGEIPCKDAEGQDSQEGAGKAALDPESTQQNGSKANQKLSEMAEDHVDVSQGTATAR